MRRPPTAAEIAAYRGRDWALVAAAKRVFWAESSRRRGPAAGADLSGALWEHARAVDPTWPGEQQRGADLAHHTAVARRLASIAHVLPGRFGPA